MQLMGIPPSAVSTCSLYPIQEVVWPLACQTAFNIDPRSACKIDPPEWPTGATGPQARPAAGQERFLKRQLSLPVSMISQ